MKEFEIAFRGVWAELLWMESGFDTPSLFGRINHMEWFTNWLLMLLQRLRYTAKLCQARI